MHKPILLFGALLIAMATTWTGHAEPAPERMLSLEEFIQLATTHDTEFERILVDELALAYERDLRLPARDIVLSVKEEFVSFQDASHDDFDTTISLSKLFPFTGTEITADYRVRPAADERSPSSMGFSMAQPIAKNAFGRSTRMLDDIIGLDIDVARHQIVEAYEDYLATIIVTYYNWWAARENLAIGQSSYDQNLKLLDNIIDRQKSQIALPIDVNKTRLQLLAKKESLIELAETYTNRLNQIERAIRHDGSTTLVPKESEPLTDDDLDFASAFAAFREASRTFNILSILEERGVRSVDREADDLLPSIDLLFGVEARGDDYGINEREDVVFAGISLAWPFGHQVDRAELEVARIDLDRKKLDTENTRHRLQTRLQNLHLQLQRERELMAIANEKIGLAREVLEAETENYSFGKVSLNDYIDAVNVLDNNRFNRLRHDALYKVLSVEWLRLTDQLVSRADIADMQ